MSQEKNKKKLRLTANSFAQQNEPSQQASKQQTTENIYNEHQNQIPYSNYNPLGQNIYPNSSNFIPYYYQNQHGDNCHTNQSNNAQNQNQQTRNPKKEKVKKEKKIQKVDDEVKKQFIVSKNDSEINNVNLGSFIPIKSSQKKPKKEIQKDEILSSDEDLKFDPKCGYWHYTHDEYLRLQKKQNDKAQTKKEKSIRLLQAQEKQLKLQELQIQRKQTKVVEKRKRRQNLLGLARIGKIIFDLRQSRNLLTVRNTKKEYKFQVNVEGQVDIVEKLKKKKLSKIKKSKLQYLEDFNNNFDTFNQSVIASDINDSNSISQSVNKLDNQKNTTIGIGIDEAIPSEDQYETIAELTENETHEIEMTKKHEKIQQKIKQEDSEEQSEQLSENDSERQKNDKESDQEQQLESKDTSQISVSENLKQIEKADLIRLAKTWNNLQGNPISSVIYNMMKVRGWVNHMICKELDDTVLLFINSLALMQAKKKILEPKKFKKRIVAGFNEVKRTLNTTLQEKMSKMILLPINILENPLPDGSDQKVIELIKICTEKKIPYLNASNRSKFNRAFCGKFGSKISAISVINYQGQEELFQKLINLHTRLQEEYSKLYNFNVMIQLQ